MEIERNGKLQSWLSPFKGELTFRRWEPIRLVGLFRNVRCDQGQVEVVDEAMQIVWSEVESKRVPQDSAALFPS